MKVFSPSPELMPGAYTFVRADGSESSVTVELCDFGHGLELGVDFGTGYHPVKMSDIPAWAVFKTVDADDADDDNGKRVLWEVNIQSYVLATSEAQAREIACQNCKPNEARAEKAESVSAQWRGNLPYGGKGYDPRKCEEVLAGVPEPPPPARGLVSGGSNGT